MSEVFDIGINNKLMIHPGKMNIGEWYRIPWNDMVLRIIKREDGSVDIYKVEIYSVV